MTSVSRRSFLVATILAITGSSLFAQLQTDGPFPKRQHPELAFVANQSDNTVSAYEIKSSGGLQPVSGTFPAGGSPNSVTVVPSGRFAYIADTIPGGITGFKVARNGTLSPLPGSPFPAPTGTAFVTTDPSGRFLYALNCGSVCSGNGPGNIAAYNINQQTGDLTPATGSPFLSGQFPYTLAIDPTGEFAYVANYGSGDVFSYSIDSQTGALSQIGPPIPAGTRPISIAVDPWGQFVYTANTGSSDISGFFISFNGAPYPIPNSPFAVAPFTGSIATSHNGKFVIAAAGPGTYVYSVDNNGALHLVSGSPFPAGLGPNGVAIDANDTYAYVVSQGSASVDAYRFNHTTGSLRQVKGTPTLTGKFPAGITATPAPLH